MTKFLSTREFTAKLIRIEGADIIKGADIIIRKTTTNLPIIKFILGDK